MREWTFLTNHACVLGFLAQYPQITAIELAKAIGITERATRRIIADLHANGYINKTRRGKRVTYSINPQMPLRHEGYHDISVNDFLKALGLKTMSSRLETSTKAIKY